MATMPCVDAQRAMAGVQISVRIRGLSLMRLRIAAGVFFFKLGAKIIGCKVVIEDDGEA